jgi:competence protein ComEA
MKRFIMSIALVAFVAAMLAPLALAQTGSATPSSTPSAAPATEPAKAEPAKTEKHQSAPKIDINSASKEELMSLPGVGDATADKIIAGRPFKSKSDLTKKKIVGSKEYDKIKNHIVAHQETPAAK